MSNTFTNVIPTAYAALNEVSREMVGIIPAVSRSIKMQRAALNATVRVPVAPQMTASNYTPAATAPQGADRAVTFIDLSLSKARKISWHVTGEEELSLGENASPISQDTIAEGIRTLVNEAEGDVTGVYSSASRAVGTAGTTPFATANDFTDFAEVHRVLTENGAAQTGRQLVLGSPAISKIRGKQSSLFKANEAGTEDLLRRGVIGDIEGLGIHESAQVKTHTAGTASGATTDNAGYAVGATVLTLASAGTGTIVAGDVVTFAGDTNQYVVTSGDTDVSNGGTITIQEPGLRVAMSAATKAITVKATHAANLAFTRDAIAFAMRPPAIPQGGDNAAFRQNLSDSMSRLSFDLVAYRQYGQISWEIQAVWGWGVPNPRHLHLLLG